MPKYTKDPVQAVSVGLRQSDREFVNRVGVGDNIGARLRSIIEQCANTIDNIAGAPGSFLVYEQTEDGQKIWNKTSLVHFSRTEGWQRISDTAKAAGFVTQVIEHKELGTIQVWIAPGRKLKDCEACKRRVLECMG
jgi:hypothetical protein